MHDDLASVLTPGRTFRLPAGDREISDNKCNPDRAFSRQVERPEAFSVVARLLSPILPILSTRTEEIGLVFQGATAVHDRPKWSTRLSVWALNGRGRQGSSSSSQNCSLFGGDIKVSPVGCRTPAYAHRKLVFGRVAPCPETRVFSLRSWSCSFFTMEHFATYLLCFRYHPLLS